MSDYLLVHGAGQGAWIWGKVWGHMTAPEEHPPRLYRPRPAERVRAIDLPGHGADRAADVALADLSDAVQTIAAVVERENFTDYILAGHELGGTVALYAAGELPTPPRRIILVAGIVPGGRAAPASAYPLITRAAIRASRTLGALVGKDIGVPSGIIGKYWCRGLDAMQRTETVGHFGPLPIGMLTRPAPLNLDSLPCPVTYVVLGRDRLIAPAVQRRMAARIPGASVVELDAAHQAGVQKPRELAETLLAA